MKKQFCFFEIKSALPERERANGLNVANVLKSKNYKVLKNHLTFRKLAGEALFDLPVVESFGGRAIPAEIERFLWIPVKKYVSIS